MRAGKNVKKSKGKRVYKSTSQQVKKSTLRATVFCLLSSLLLRVLRASVVNIGLAMNSLTQTGPYIPRSNHGFALFITAFSQGIAANPAKYGCTQADVNVLLQQMQLYLDADRIATTDRTRTKITVAERDSIRASIEPFYRAFAQRIKYNEGISDPDKINIGVRPRNSAQSQRVAPSSSPMVMIYAAGNGTHTLRYHDSMTPTSKAKPFGAVCMQLFMDKTDGTRQPSLEHAQFIGTYTKSLFGVEHDPKDAGQLATYWARWAGPRGDTGPWSFPVSFTIAWGGAMPIAAKRVDEDDSLKLAA